MNKELQELFDAHGGILRTSELLKYGCKKSDRFNIGSRYSEVTAALFQ